MDSDWALNESTLALYIGELDASQVDDPRLSVLDAVHKLL
ncbi:hypothetical protein SynRS9915_00995 [Synechococcus sp. RS9915]|nr:hypothetical protein SynRS9915_00995 [Synechococcus sp. RS9915]